MLKKQKRSLITEYISENRIRVIINICFAIFGIICGGVLFLYSKDTQDVTSWAKEYISNLSSTAAKDVFISAAEDAGIVCAVFYICSLFYIGEFLCPVYVFIRCMAYGFSNCLVLAFCGFKNGIMILLSLVPHLAFYIVAFIVFSVETAKQSRFMGGSFDKGTKTGSFISYFISTLIPVCILLAGCLVEGFLSPHFILWCVK